MADDAADISTGELPEESREPATKADLAAGFRESNLRLAEGLLDARDERSQLNEKIVQGLADAKDERGQLVKKITDGLAEAKADRARIEVAITKDLSALDNKITAGLSEARDERSKLGRQSVRQMYVTLTGMAVMVAPMWIELLTRGLGG